ncbi:hypothetical protein HY483_01890 [Candidatus Woesearchaeota archaeon]|nr:hypothetical protein [Candidatus Woesearchaeota archaeon]
MDIVIDANILFAILIKSGDTEQLLYQEDLRIYAPEFLFEEFLKYKNLIIQKTQRTEKEFKDILETIKKKIILVPNEETNIFIKEAEKISPDKKDTDYFAIALKLHCPLWSNDKQLKNQDTIKIYTTAEIRKLFYYE